MTNEKRLYIEVDLVTCFVSVTRGSLTYEVRSFSRSLITTLGDLSSSDGPVLPS